MKISVRRWEMKKFEGIGRKANSLCSRSSTGYEYIDGSRCGGLSSGVSIEGVHTLVWMWIYLLKRNTRICSTLCVDRLFYTAAGKYGVPEHGSCERATT